MKLGNLEVTVGEKKSGWMKVVGCEYEMPVTVICGGVGKTTLITAGVHSAEYVGMQAAIELSAELQPEDIDGTLVIVPVVNVSGFEHRGLSMVYEDGKNLNRVFPGSQGGTLAEKISYTMETELFSLADYYIDLHSGDGFEELCPYVYYVGPVEKTVREKAYKMAQCVDTAYIVESQSASGGAYNYANSLGIPSILLERGGRGIWSREDVELDKADVKRILDMLYKDKKPVRTDFEKQHVFKEVVYEDAPYTGCWYPNFRPGDSFCKNDVLGEIKTYFGETLYKSVAEADGVVLYQVCTLNVLEDGPMIAYGVMDTI